MLFDRTFPPLTGTLSFLYWICIALAVLALFLPLILDGWDKIDIRKSPKWMILGIAVMVIFAVLAYIILRVHTTNILVMWRDLC